MASISERAAEARKYFHRIERSEGDTIWTGTDDRPDWVQDMTFKAHGDMLPDDWKYEFVVSALDMIEERDSEEVGDYFEDIDGAVDIYNHDLHRWLSSNLQRAGYVDEATEEMGSHSEMGVNGDLMMGQFREREEVLGIVLNYLVNEIEDDDEDDEEEEEDDA